MANCSPVAAWLWRWVAAAVVAVCASSVAVGAGAGGSPSFQQLGGKLLASDETGAGGFGWSVALSADGGTALIGGPEDKGGVTTGGSVWLFARSGSGWTQMGDKLFRGSGFGTSVALSADGSRALVGAPFANAGGGAAFVFRRSGSQFVQEEELSPNDETAKAEFGVSVALSADGGTALVGSEDDGTIPGIFPNQGAAWVFTRSGSSWSQQGPKLTGSGETGAGAFGESVALSADGNLAVIGAPSDGQTFTNGTLGGNQIGAVWTFTRSGSTWSARGPKLVPAAAGGNAYFGSSVAVSANAGILAVGGPGDSSGSGAVWAYRFNTKAVIIARPLSSWLLLGSKLTPAGEAGPANLGRSVALSADGSVLAAGGPGDNAAGGAAWLFSQSGSGFVQEPGKLVASDESAPSLFGSSTAIAADGNSVLLGGYWDAKAGQTAIAGIGAAWAFVNPPAISAISPASGPTAGGTKVTISGSGLKGATAVRFGPSKAASFTVDSASQISAVAPPGKAGAVDVTVSTSAGDSPVSAADRFTYTSPAPTTTTTSTTTKTITTTTTTAKPASKPPVARIVYATVVRHGKHRTLTVRIRVSEAATAQLELFVHQTRRLTKTFLVKGGANVLKAPLAPSIKQGTDRLQITLRDAHNQQMRYSTSVRVPV
jgi:hypothetical protein